ncbi:MAG: hypothetical protein WB424_12280 [Terracidiphilus sp.]
MHRAHDREPDRLAELHEGLIMDHTECWEFDDPAEARERRRYRKEKKRREILRTGGFGLAAQCVSWRGR